MEITENKVTLNVVHYISSGIQNINITPSSVTVDIYLGFGYSSGLALEEIREYERNEGPEIFNTIYSYCICYKIAQLLPKQFEFLRT